MRRREQKTRQAERQALLRQPPAFLPPALRVREHLNVQGLTLQPGQLLNPSDPLLKPILDELGDNAPRFFEVVRR
jgi:hypothetical protein